MRIDRRHQGRIVVKSGLSAPFAFIAFIAFIAFKRIAPVMSAPSH